MLVGREGECARIDELLERSRAGRSGALVVRGEAGIGKTALLDYAVGQSGNARVVRALGVESEAELEFSALHELCRPLESHLDELPERQSEALRSALGLGPAEPTDRFTIGAATLTLFAAAAEHQPLLVIVDDAHWVDRSSQDALVFAARRLQADCVVLLFGAREGELRPFEAEGLETLGLAGFGRDTATALMRLRNPGVDTLVADRLFEATGGNPLALIELPQLLTDAQLAGSEPLEEPLPAGASVERAFARRAEALPPQARSALLVAAVSTTTELEPILRALVSLGIEPLFEPAEDAGLIHVRDARVAFHHPLVRSAVHQAATPSERRAAHRALAEALVGTDTAEQRAWHLAGAAIGPDEEVAAALAAAADSARERSGYAAASAALERAARLTPEGEARLLRLFGAARDAWLAGRGAWASELLAEVLPGSVGHPLRGDVLRLHGSIEYFAGRTSAGSSILLDAATALDAAGRPGAVSAAADAVNSAIPSGDPVFLLAAAEKARKLAAADGGESDFEASVALGYALCFNGRVKEGEALIRHGADLFTARTTVSAPLQIGRYAWALGWLGRHEEAQAQVVETIRLARAAGAIASLPYLLGATAWHGVHLGRLTQAYADASEELDLGDQLGQPLARAQALPLISWLHAIRGEEDACRERAAQALEVTGELGLRLYGLLAWLALGVLDAGAGRWEEAIPPLEEAERGMTGLYIGGMSPSLELAEAYARTGRVDAAQTILAAFDRSELGTAPLQAALAARCRGVLAGADEFEPYFLSALDQHTRAVYPFARARTQLAYGERLRRVGRRTDARVHLRAAAYTFGVLGATAWSTRAHDELRASGQTLRRGYDSEAELTPRELQVALQVADGKSNKEAAAALFLSPKTIEYHLKRVYRKLDMHSRAELIRRFSRAESVQVDR